MSERPFMQLYVSDFIGDTLHLTTEQVGAYLLLLMAMWNAGGSLPDDEAKLARIVRMSARKWRAVAADLMVFFEREGGAVRHHRLTKELQKSGEKSAIRSAAGKRGATAKALKSQAPSPANASRLLKHSPETINQNAAAQHSAREPTLLYDRLIQAASSRGPCHPNLGFGIGPITDLVAKGYDLDRDILPIIRERASPERRSWSYFVAIIVDEAARRAAIPLAPTVKSVDWSAAMQVWRDDETWSPMWGPKPGERGCRVPPELLRGSAA